MQLRRNDKSFFSINRSNTAQKLGQKPSESHNRVLKEFFGLLSGHGQQWPGIYVYFRDVEQAMQTLLDHNCDVLSKVVYPLDAWSWALAVVAAFRELDDANASVENAYQRMLSIKGLRPGAFNSHQKTFIMIAIFATTGWLTMLFTPNITEGSLAVLPQDQSVFRVLGYGATNAAQSVDAARRPLAKMLKGFRRCARHSETSVTGSDEIYASSLSYHSLFTIGKIQLKWVDDFGIHMEFDRQSKCVYVFRLPSFCATTIVRKCSDKVFEWYSF